LRVTIFADGPVASVTSFRSLKVEPVNKDLFVLPAGLKFEDRAKPATPPSTSSPGAAVESATHAAMVQVIDQLRRDAQREKSGLPEAPPPCDAGRATCIIDLSDGTTALHVIAIRGDPHDDPTQPVAGRSAITVDAPGRPLVLVLAASGPMHWVVSVARDSKLRQIVAFGMTGEQTISAPPGIPVTTRSDPHFDWIPGGYISSSR
jgi:hypothetical protein